MTITVQVREARLVLAARVGLLATDTTARKAPNMPLWVAPCTAGGRGKEKRDFSSKNERTLLTLLLLCVTL